jgi:hypothetical protein
MIWIDNILQLQYYNQPKDVPCYCDIIIFPYDLTLQGSFAAGGGSYSIAIDVLSANGLTMYENATSYFDYYFAVNPVTGQHFFNARLKAFAPSMCTHACYILHVTVARSGNVVFDKYTERYCQSSCCDLARDINIAQDSIITGGGGGPLSDGTTTTANPKQSECGDPLITLTTRFDCYDKFSGAYYGTPSDVLSGSANFSYYKFTNMRGRIVKRPREITREYSYNCRLQKVESKHVFLLQGYEYFPQWKMDEIETQLHSTEIYVEGIRYEYAGGTPFTQLHNCREVFKLETELESCTIRQMFGCGEPCGQATNFDGSMQAFVIPAAYQGGAFYNESKMKVADDYDQLLLYFRGLDGMAALNDIDVSGLDCDVYKAFGITGAGYLPGSLYYDAPVAANRVFAVRLAGEEEICLQFAPLCARPVIVPGDIVVEDQPCIVPEPGTPVVAAMTATEVNVNGYGSWAVQPAGTEVHVADSIVTLNLLVANSTITEDPDHPGDPVYIAGHFIAVLGGAARPAADVVLNSSNSALTGDTLLRIDTHGLVQYVGNSTLADATHIEIQLTNITYTL